MAMGQSWWTLILRLLDVILTALSRSSAKRWQIHIQPDCTPVLPIKEWTT